MGKPTKGQEIMLLVEELMANAGHVFCPECSVDNKWNVYHLPGQHISKRHPRICPCKRQPVLVIGGSK